MKPGINRKSILIALACVLVVALCVCAALIFSSQRSYETVENSSAGETVSPSKSISAQKTDGSQSSALEKQGISITLQTELPEDFDPFRYIKQAYELKNLMAVQSFQSADDIPVNPVVQYAFCYLYTGGECLVDFETGTMTYREATESEIREQIARLFGDCPFDVKESNLYATGKQKFEMWQPNYSRPVYASAQFKSAESGTYQLEISYFEDEEKTRQTSTSVITVKPAKTGGYYLASMT